MGSAGIQRYDPGAVKGRKYGVRAEFRSLLLVLRMSIRSVPMATYDRLAFHTGLCGVHTIDPPCLRPSRGACMPPACIIVVLAVFIDTGNPAVDEDIVLSLEGVQHGRNNLPGVRRSLCSIGKVKSPDTCHCRIIARQLKRCIICAVKDMMAIRFPMVLND